MERWDVQMQHPGVPKGLRVLSESIDLTSTVAAKPTVIMIGGHCSSSLIITAERAMMQSGAFIY